MKSLRLFFLCVALLVSVAATNAFGGGGGGVVTEGPGESACYGIDCGDGTGGSCCAALTNCCNACDAMCGQTCGGLC
jgi:hypothetical protein